MLQSHLPPVAEPPQGCHVSQPSDLCAVRIEVIKDTSYQLWPNLDSFKSFPPHSAFLRLNINWFKRRLSALYADSPVTTDIVDKLIQRKVINLFPALVNPGGSFVVGSTWKYFEKCLHSEQEKWGII